jgi:hypothetical protein
VIGLAVMVIFSGCSGAMGDDNALRTANSTRVVGRRMFFMDLT